MGDKEKVVNRLLEEEKRYLWCPKCKKYPDVIMEKWVHVNERIWNGDYAYELVNELDIECIFEKCCECKTDLENKE